MSSAGKLAPGFGIGALEELDVEDEDIYASGEFLKLPSPFVYWVINSTK